MNFVHINGKIRDYFTCLLTLLNGDCVLLVYNVFCKYFKVVLSYGLLREKYFSLCCYYILWPPAELGLTMVSRRVLLTLPPLGSWFLVRQVVAGLEEEENISLDIIIFLLSLFLKKFQQAWRECVTRFSTSIIFHDTNPSIALINRPKYFRIPCQIRRDIRS